MLKDRILATLKFFDLQDYPLTLLELHQFLLEEPEKLRQLVGLDWELVESAAVRPSPPVEAGQILSCLETECQGLVDNFHGFYHFLGRESLVRQRQASCLWAIKREKLIRRFIGKLKDLPFVRGVGLTGSQALGQQKKDSDIDLLIITDARFMWLCRTLVTAYFQMLGLRRHDHKVVNRFCLNHYLAGAIPLKELRNLYTAMEYIKLRPLVYKDKIAEFQAQNSSWMRQVFPTWQPFGETAEPQGLLQRSLEKIFNNRFGLFLESMLKRWQLPRIKKEEFILVKADELSFHPGSRQQSLLAEFFSPGSNFLK